MKEVRDKEKNWRKDFRRRGHLANEADDAVDDDDSDDSLSEEEERQEATRQSSTMPLFFQT